MNLGHTYMKWYICICIMQRRNHDGHLTFYLLLSGFTVEIIRFPVFLSFWHPALCIYLYPVADPGDFQAIWDRGPRTIRDKLQEDSPIELMIIKLKEMAYYKLDIVFLLLF